MDGRELQAQQQVNSLLIRDAAAAGRTCTTNV